MNSNTLPCVFLIILIVMVGCATQPAPAVPAAPVEEPTDQPNDQEKLQYYKDLTLEVHGKEVYTGTNKRPEKSGEIVPGLILIIDIQQIFAWDIGAERYGLMMPFVLEVLDYANNHDPPIPIIVATFENKDGITVKIEEDGTRIETHVFATIEIEDETGTESQDSMAFTLEFKTPGTHLIPPEVHGSTILDVQKKVDENTNPDTKTIVKNGPDAVENSNLLYELENLGIEPGDNGKYIYVMGLYASLCILDTVKSLREEGYNVAVSFDTIANSEEVDEEDAEYSKWDWYFEKTKAAAFYWEVLNIPPPDWYADPGKTILDFRQIKLMEMASWGAQLLDYDSLPDAWTILRD